MSSESTRRDFLKLSGIGIASVAAGVSASESTLSASTAPSTPGKISVWVTDDHQRLARGSDISWQPMSDAGAKDAVVLNPEKRCQSILGFGAAFTDAACYTLSQLSPATREKLFHELFGSSEMALNVCRICVGASDYSTRLYTYDEGEPDPELLRFSIDHDRQYILPILREARRVSPDLFLFASPWSPPGWMKANGSMLGGSMRRKHMSSYAQYFLKFVQSYEKEGVPVGAVTVQNEVDTDQDGRMPACIWPQEYEVDFVRSHLGPLFERNSVKTQIWLVDHNYNLWGRAAAELETPELRKYANAIAWHGYMGEPEWIDRVQNMYPDVAMHWTEGGPDYNDPNYANDWTDWSKTFTGILRNCCRSITAWNFALDEQGRPNIGPFNCGGMITVNSQTKVLSYSGQFFGLAHYSRFIRRGGVRFDSQSTAKDLHHCSFQNPKGGCLLVLTNPGPARTCQLQQHDNTANLSLTANSITTLAWS
jgi:glucosylceramidase